jgi:heterodisulfide reductase subunit B
MKYAYYPGCSLGSTAAPYDTSTKAIAEALQLRLDEIEDWNCCGASEYFSVHKTAAYALVARNLAIASKQNGFTDVVAPCSACFLNLKKTDHYMATYPEIESNTRQSLAAGGLDYVPGTLTVRHLLDVIVSDIGLDSIQSIVSNPLTNLRVAPYYGCLVTRPSFDENGFDDPEYPTHLDELLEVLGANVIDYPLKAHCCGGHMTQISSETAFELIRRLLHNANEYGADVIVTVCPMCQLNLDAYQSQVNRHFGTTFNLPVLYFTQMIGLALGIEPSALGIGKEFVSPATALQKIGTAVEDTAAAPRKRKKDDKSLPMPEIRGER